MICVYCQRPVWDEARAVALDDPISALTITVHRGCARRRARVERELDLAARKGRAAESPGRAAASAPT